MSAPARSLPKAGVPARWATRRTRRASFGRKVAEVASALGLELLPWQRQVVDVALEHVRGQLVYRDVVVSVPRQAGKSVLLLTVIVHRLLASHCAAVYGAQSRLEARQKMLLDWWPARRARRGLGVGPGGGAGREAGPGHQACRPALDRIDGRHRPLAVVGRQGRDRP
jgi:hypothetical protein